MTFRFKTFKGVVSAATLTVASLAWSTAAIGDEKPQSPRTAYYQKQIERQIDICQSKSALQFSRFDNVRELGRKYGLKLAYLTRQQDQLVEEMAGEGIAAKPYRVHRFINADFHKTLERFEMKLAQR